ncbi:hypothetical protein HDV05_002789 [Chytridiales sp. JEL 0842]|nr:hypothetical protein HDV05_002789 [Chytridiales sp. JEL 0842]
MTEPQQHPADSLALLQTHAEQLVPPVHIHETDSTQIESDPLKPVSNSQQTGSAKGSQLLDDETPIQDAEEIRNTRDQSRPRVLSDVIPSSKPSATHGRALLAPLSLLETENGERPPATGTSELHTGGPMTAFVHDDHGGAGGAFPFPLMEEVVEDVAGAGDTNTPVVPVEEAPQNQSQLQEQPTQSQPVDETKPSVRFQLIPYHEDPANINKSLTLVERELEESKVIRIGRQVVRDGQPVPPPRGKLSKNADLDVWYVSKVVSRNHAELWLRDGQLYVKDIGSSSGTFLNKMRLSPSGKESRPYPLKEGDILQFGMDYRGKSEDVYRSVTLKIGFFDNSWIKNHRKSTNPVRFRSALKALLAATNPYASSSNAPLCDPTKATEEVEDPNNTADTDCCICIGAIAPLQAIFISPCSHCFHYKCVSTLVAQSVMFQCPLCRQVANLAASVSTDDLLNEDDDKKQDDEVGASGRNKQATMVPDRPSVNTGNEEDGVLSPAQQGDSLQVTDLESGAVSLRNSNFDQGTGGGSTERLANGSENQNSADPSPTSPDANAYVTANSVTNAISPSTKKPAGGSWFASRGSNAGLQNPPAESGPSSGHPSSAVNKRSSISTKIGDFFKRKGKEPDHQHE